MYKNQSQYIPLNKEVLEMMKSSRSIYDCALYIEREIYFKTKEEKKIKSYKYNELWNIVKETEQYKSSKLDISPKTYAIRQVSDAWSSYIKAVMAYKKNPSKFTARPQLPNYLYKKKDYNIIKFDKTRFRAVDETNNTLRLPCTNVILNVPKNIKIKDIKQITIEKVYDKLKVNYITEDLRYIDNEVKKGVAIGIDIGLNNLMAITTNDNENPFSYIVKGGYLKSLNQMFNKEYAKYKSIFDRCNKKGSRCKNEDGSFYTEEQYLKDLENGTIPPTISKRLAVMLRKRHNRINNYLHRATKTVVMIAIEAKAEKIVIGHNDLWKQNINLGHRTNQNFVQIPFNALIDMIKQYAEKYINLEVITVEESYTSKCDHLAHEDMCHHDTYLGKRVKRGLFHSSCGRFVNGDINGAIGVLRKANVFPDAALDGLRNRGDYVSPVVLKI